MIKFDGDQQRTNQSSRSSTPRTKEESHTPEGSNTKSTVISTRVREEGLEPRKRAQPPQRGTDTVPRALCPLPTVPK